VVAGLVAVAAEKEMRWDGDKMEVRCKVVGGARDIYVCRAARLDRTARVD
jgi:hypothetical protein